MKSGVTPDFYYKTNTTCYARGNHIALALSKKTSSDKLKIAWQLETEIKEVVYERHK